MKYLIGQKVWIKSGQGAKTYAQVVKADPGLQGANTIYQVKQLVTGKLFTKVENRLAESALDAALDDLGGAIAGMPAGVLNGALYMEPPPQPIVPPHGIKVGDKRVVHLNPAAFPEVTINLWNGKVVTVVSVDQDEIHVDAEPLGKSVLFFTDQLLPVVTKGQHLYNWYRSNCEPAWWTWEDTKEDTKQMWEADAVGNLTPYKELGYPGYYDGAYTPPHTKPKYRVLNAAVVAKPIYKEGRFVGA
jgi:hypothetical protein